MQVTDIEVKCAIEKMLDLLNKPEAWTQFAEARLPNHWATFADNPKAVCFCLSGALRRVEQNPYIRERARNLIMKDYMVDWGCIPWWNDEPGRTYEDVISLLKRVRDDLDD